MEERVKVFDNFDDLKESIRKHNKEAESDVTIIPANSPLELKIGFACIETEQAWQIKIKDMMKWAAEVNENFSISGTDDSISPIIRTELITKALKNITLEEPKISH